MLLNSPPLSLRCEHDPSHGASLHIVSSRPGGLAITAHVCADHLDLWIAQMERWDGHQLQVDRPIDGWCRPYGLCSIR